MIDDTSRPADGRDFETFFRAQWAPMVGLAVLLTGDRAAAPDLVQQVFLRMLRRWDRIVEPSAYVVVSVRNAAASYRRSAHRGSTLWLVSDEPLNEDSIGAGVDVRRALRCLRRPQYEVIVMRYYLQLSDTEIAESLGRRLGTVKSQLRRALKSLERELAP